MALDQKKFDGLGITLTGIVTGVSTTQKGKILLTVLAGEDTQKVICEKLSKQMGQDYVAKVRCFAAGNSVMFMEREMLG